jgi:hypothetical protein
MLGGQSKLVPDIASLVNEHNVCHASILICNQVDTLPCLAGRAGKGKEFRQSRGGARWVRGSRKTTDIVLIGYPRKQKDTA